MLSQLFPTPVLKQRPRLAPKLLADLRDYLLSLRAAGPGEQRSNCGGWHSAGDLFDAAEHRHFPEFTETITGAVVEYFTQAMAFEGRVSFALNGWAVINAPGDFNAPHNHAKNLLSGVFYVQVPEGMRGGELVFMDPRLHVNAYGGEEMRRIGLRPPWDLPTLAHPPATGDLLVFPSWLMHYVNPFCSASPADVRIVVSFNVAV
jgi:uncharacterized protein (TIGR02466 family)